VKSQQLDNNKKLDIIVPVYNEKDLIIKTLKTINESIFTRHQIIIVYDSDEDNTLSVVEQYLLETEQDNIFLIRNKVGKSLSGALQAGFNAACSPYVAVVMADLSDDLKITDEMVGLLDKGYDLVCGSRYMKTAKQIGGQCLKSFLINWPVYL